MTTLVMENQQAILCIVELHATVNNIKISSVALNVFYGEIAPPETMNPTPVV
jgi:hypothetical protein